MASESEHSLTDPDDNPATIASSPTPPPMGCRATVHLCSQVRQEVLERLAAARAAGNECRARRLEEEAEVLQWKMRRAMNPAREVPPPILARFNDYTGHPQLPDAWLR